VVAVSLKKRPALPYAAWRPLLEVVDWFG